MATEASPCRIPSDEAEGKVNCTMERLPEGRYCMFLRKSREDIEAEKLGHYETLARHEEELRRLAAVRGIEVSEVYRELVSGDSLDARPECRRLLGDVCAGKWAGVLVVDLQRLTRGDMIDQGTIMRGFALTRTLIVTPDKVLDPADECDGNYMEFNMFFGRWEYGAIKKRLVAGKDRSVREGQYIGSIAPYGYDKVDVDRKHTLRPNADAEAVAQWFEDIAHRRTTCHAIADTLNLQGVPTPRGRRWDAKTVKQIISNPVYIGMVRWNQRETRTEIGRDMEKRKVRRRSESPILVEGLHRPIVTREAWNAANEVLAERAAKAVSSKQLANPLATLLVCARCGRAMRIAKSGDIRNLVHSPANRAECWQVGARLPVVVAALADALEAMAEDMEVASKEDDGKSAYTARRIADLERAAEAEDAAVANLLRLAEKGLVTDDEFADRRAKADARREAALKEARALRRQRRSKEGAGRTAVTLREAVALLREADGRAAEVNAFLKTFISRIEYEKDPETRKMSLGVVLKGQFRD